MFQHMPYLYKKTSILAVQISVYTYIHFFHYRIYIVPVILTQLSSCCKSKVGEIFYPSFFLLLLADLFSCREKESQLLQWALQTDRANLLTFCTRKENSSSSSNLASSTIFSCTTRVGVKVALVNSKSSFSDLLVQSHYFILGICVSYQLQYMLFMQQVNMVVQAVKKISSQQ